jgi:hypothetical protein
MRKPTAALAALVAVGALTGAGVAGLSPTRSTSALGACTPARPRTTALAVPRRIMAGASLAAVDRGALQVFGTGGNARGTAPDRLAGAIRHVTARAGVGTAYVRDRAGADVVVEVTAAGGVRRFAAGGEATHPTLSAAGDLAWAVGADLRLVAGGATRPSPIRGPIREGLAFSPVFRGVGTIVAAVADAPTRAVPEDEYLSNLWGYRIGTGAWTRMTRFTAGTDRWSIVRTPVVRPDGAVEFVRIVGRASVDRQPRYQLWRLTPRGARLERPLPGEMYLAGYEAGTRVWNIPAGSTGSWRLVGEAADGTLHDVGCGAAMVDPLDRVDPDLQPGDRFAPLHDPAAASPSAAPAPADTANAIIVGDFSTASSAADAADTITAATGLQALVTDATQLPALVRPGVSAVEVLLPPVPDPEEQLATFRSKLPSLAGWSWLVAV